MRSYSERTNLNMKKAVVYWSGTGNTEAMAKAVAEAAGAELFTASEFSAAKADEFDAIAFGCPAMGAEALEESEFEPMFARRSRSSAPTAGATATGCRSGRTTAAQPALTSFTTASSATASPMLRHLQSARPSAPRCKHL